MTPSSASSPAGGFLETGQLWAASGAEASVRVVEFAGHPVPEEGLSLIPPQGGELTVWPDGRYEFVIDDEAQIVGLDTYFGYVAEDAQGAQILGSFSVDEVFSVPEAMSGFQSWSMDDLLALSEAGEVMIPDHEFADVFTGDVFESLGADAIGNHASMPEYSTETDIVSANDLLQHMLTSIPEA